MPIAEPSSSRLFHAVVLMGCALSSFSGCVDPAVNSTQQAQCTVPDPDAGIVGDDGCVPDLDGAVHDAGWPPTK